MKKQIILLFFFYQITLIYPQNIQLSPIPESCGQLVLVVTPSIASSHGKLIRFTRGAVQSEWKQVGDSVNVLVGKKGLAWGIGLHKLDEKLLPLKREGDGKSPAGVFTLSTAFGYLPAEKLGELKIPYIQVSQTLECVDDVNSRYYNQLIEGDKVESRDWQSSERMLLSGIWYELGVVVDHNTGPAERGSGSCIFLHNWSDPADSTTGCTAMDRSDLKVIIQWLDISKEPVLVQLTRELYAELQSSWILP
jgi:D-alanyl-D-alanine dipeptidase